MFLINPYFYAAPSTLLLDLYPNAAAAYSLRKLRSAYSGSAIRVRRSSDNTESDIGFVSNQLDTSTLLTFCGAGSGFVTTWYDQSGNSRDIIQITPANQPQIVTTGVVNLQGTKPTLSFNGTSQFLTRTDAGLPTGNATYITLTRTFANPSTYYVFLSYGQLVAAQNVSLLYGPTLNANSPTTIGVTNYGESFGQISRSPNLYNLQVVLKPLIYAPWYQYINNSLSINETRTANTTLSGTFTIGNGLGYYFSGNMQETIIYSVQQTTNRTAIETNINNFYQIYWQGTGTALLDLYPSAAAAYSLRNLSSTYLGPLVRVRRTDGVEIDICGLYNGELDTATLLTFSGVNTCKIIKWYDQSGNGNNASASDPTSASNPTIVNAGVLVISNGKPSLNFIINPLNFLTNIASSANTSIYLVGKSNAANNGPMIGTAGSGCIAGQVNGYYQMNMGATTNLDIYQTGASSADTNFNITSFYYVGSASVYRNNTLIPITTTLTATLSSNTLQNIGNYGGAFWTSGFISEVIIYKANQLSNRTGINGNINTFYTIF